MYEFSPSVLVSRIAGILLAISLSATASAQESKGATEARVAAELAAQDIPAIIPPASGAEVSLDGLTPADVLARVKVIQEELEQIRFETGKPPFSIKAVSVKSALPRQVLFQASSMFAKSSMLLFELTGLRPPPLSTRIAKDVRPGQVWMTANDTYRTLLMLRSVLQIPNVPREIVQDPETTPADVLVAVVATNRMLQHLLNTGPSSRDVLERVLVAEAVIARLLQDFPGSAIRSPGPLQRGKSPADVYLVLYGNLNLLTKIAGHYDFETIQPGPSVTLSKAEKASLNPSRVYDMATLIASELIYLDATQSDVELPTAEISNYILPSHVYQHAEALRLNMLELEKHLKNRQ
jgi:hypothetical protein